MMMRASIRHMRDVPRSEDDRLLEWLCLRDRHVSGSAIASAYGTTKNAVLGALSRIDRDLAESEA